MRRAVRGLGAALGLAMLAGCAGGLAAGGAPPRWVDRLPRKPHTMCAVGCSGASLYQTDCHKNASDNARGHLADNISSHIQTITIDISDGSTGYFSRDVFVKGSESASEAVIQGAVIEARWLDTEGVRGQAQGCYALVCIDLNKPIESMVQQLQAGKVPPKTIEQTRRNAEKAFEELERLENAGS